MGIKKEMSGSPWHVEKAHRAENDDRRYKGRCKYYTYENNRCSYACSKCYGSAHCDWYEAITDDEFKERQRKWQQKKNKKSSDDDVYWY